MQWIIYAEVALLANPCRGSIGKEQVACTGIIHARREHSRLGTTAKASVIRTASKDFLEETSPKLLFLPSGGFETPERLQLFDIVFVGVLFV